MTRTALVTGGVSGIGAATSKLLKASGYNVITNFYGNDADAEKFGKETGIPTFCWDVSDHEVSQQAIAAIEKELGPIDILVNNAGITRDCMLHKMSWEQWISVLNINLSGAFNSCRAVINGMRERGFGRIVSISSVNGLSGQMGQTNYAATKAGLIGFTKSLALEGASKGVTANVVAPGYTETAMVSAVPDKAMEQVLAGVPLHRLAKPEEIARGVLFLVSDEAAFITGQTLSINGGKVMM